MVSPEWFYLVSINVATPVTTAFGADLDGDGFEDIASRTDRAGLLSSYVGYDYGNG